MTDEVFGILGVAVSSGAPAEARIVMWKHEQEKRRDKCAD